MTRPAISFQALNLPLQNERSPVIYILQPSMEGTGSCTSIPLIMNASISVRELFLLSCIEAAGL